MDFFDENSTYSLKISTRLKLHYRFQRSIILQRENGPSNRILFNYLIISPKSAIYREWNFRRTKFKFWKAFMFMKYRSLFIWDIQLYFRELKTQAWVISIKKKTIRVTVEKCRKIRRNRLGDNKNGVVVNTSRVRGLGKRLFRAVWYVLYKGTGARSGKEHINKAQPAVSPSRIPQEKEREKPAPENSPGQMKYSPISVYFINTLKRAGNTYPRWRKSTLFNFLSLGNAYRLWLNKKL